MVRIRHRLGRLAIGRLVRDSRVIMPPSGLLPTHLSACLACSVSSCSSSRCSMQRSRLRPACVRGPSRQYSCDLASPSPRAPDTHPHIHTLTHIHTHLDARTHTHTHTGPHSRVVVAPLQHGGRGLRCPPPLGRPVRRGRPTEAPPAPRAWHVHLPCVCVCWGWGWGWGWGGGEALLVEWWRGTGAEGVVCCAGRCTIAQRGGRTHTSEARVYAHAHNTHLEALQQVAEGLAHFRRRAAAVQRTPHIYEACMTHHQSSLQGHQPSTAHDDTG
jgi:hypothetical protein